MNAWRIHLLLLAGLWSAGCQNNGNYDLMERELRLQEDRIYQLEDELDRHCQLLKTCQEENRVLKEGKDTGATRLRLSAPAATLPSPPTNGSDGLTPPKVELDLPPLPGPTLPGPASSSPAPTNQVPPDPAMPAPSAADSLPSLRTPPPSAPSPIEVEAPPRPAPVEVPTPRSLLERGNQSWRESPATPLVRGTNEPSAPPAQARRPAWSPYR